MMIDPSYVNGEAFDVRVSPLNESHAPLLAEAAFEPDFKYFTSQPKTFDVEGWTGYIEFLNRPDSLAHALFYKGQFAGMSSMFEIDLVNRKLEIGYTLILSEFRGTSVNPASKLILMTEAFEKWGIIRVQLKGDARNSFSMKAMERNGFQYEGTLRNYSLLNESYKRTVSFYSVIDSEWQQVKAHLEQRCRGYS